MKLYWHPFSVFPRRVQIALREKGLPYAEEIIDLPGGAHRAPTFLRLNPFGQVPVLEDGALVVSESIAILEYLEERHPLPPLLPADPARRARARQLMLWSGDYLAPAWKAWMAQLFTPGVRADDATVLQGRTDVAAHLDVLAPLLADGDWLVGDYSLADVCYAPFVTTFPVVGLGDLLEDRPRVHSWVQRLLERPPIHDTAPS